MSNNNKEYSQAFLIGLPNFQNNCFINTALQVLINLPILNHTFGEKYEKKRHVLLDTKLTMWGDFYYYLLQQQRQPINSLIYRKFYESLVQNNIVEYNQPNDYHELLAMLIDNLTQIQQKLGCQITFASCLNIQINRTLDCQNCFFAKPSNEITNFLQLSNLEQNLYPLCQPVSLAHYQCEKCHQSDCHIINIHTVKLPKILLFHQPFKTTNHHLRTQYIFPNLTRKYQLYGIVCHTGTTENGHYFFILYLNQKFILINDNIIREIQPESNRDNTYTFQNVVSVILLRMK